MITNYEPNNCFCQQLIYNMWAFIFFFYLVCRLFKGLYEGIFLDTACGRTLGLSLGDIAMTAKAQEHKTKLLHFSAG